MAGLGNRVIDNDVVVVTKSDPLGTTRGIWFATPTDLTLLDFGMAVGNRVSSADVGIQMEVSNAKFRDNVTTNVATPYIGGTDLGRNH